MAVAPRAVRLWSNAGTYAFLGIVCLLMLVPIYWILATSVKPTSEILVTPTTLLTANPTLDHYGAALAGFAVYAIDIALGTTQSAVERDRRALDGLSGFYRIVAVRP